MMTRLLPSECSVATAGDERGQSRGTPQSSNPKRTAGRSDDGFTLIEVLVALAILSLSAGVVLGVFSASLDRARDSERGMAARRLAQSLLAEAQARPGLGFGRTQGETADGLRWSIIAAPYAQPGDDTALLHGESLTVTVAWDTRSMALQSLRLVPRRINK